MSQNVQSSDVPMYENDQVPDQWKGLFSNEEWFMHDIVVKATYGFLIIAVAAHTLMWLYEPWFNLAQ